MSKNKHSAIITFDLHCTKNHFISNKLCDLDQGRYAQFACGYKKRLSNIFNFKQSNIIKSRTKISVYIVDEAVY